MNIFKNKINQREYAYINTLLFIALSYIYRFGHFDIYHLRNTVETSLIVPKIIFFIIFGILLLFAFVYIALLRVNDTKISKWSIISLLVPYLGIIYSIILLFLPSEEKTKNDNLVNHIEIVSMFILIMNIILFGFNAIAFSSIFLILFFLFFIFIIDVILTKTSKLFKRYNFLNKYLKKDKITQIFKYTYSEVIKNNFNLLFFITLVCLSFYSVILLYDGKCCTDEPIFVISKLLVFITSCCSVFKIFKNTPNSKLVLLYSLLAIIFNPIFQIPFDKYQWVWVFVGATIIFLSNEIVYIKTYLNSNK